MFDYIGGKIKGLAKIICWLGIIVSVVFGIVIIKNASQDYGYYYGKQTDSTMVVVGIITMILGSVFSWAGSFVLYGFGQLVENSDELVYLKKKENTEKRTASQTVSYASGSSNIKTTSAVKESSKSWTCPDCGKQNPPTTSVCLCGTNKPKNNLVWICPNCKNENPLTRSICLCGTERPR